MPSTQTPDSLATINDQFRRQLSISSDSPLGLYRMTGAVASFTFRDKQEILRVIAEFSDFNKENDPWQEHDFGSFMYQEETIFWKIDYYDKNIEYGSADPLDPEKTIRVLA